MGRKEKSGMSLLYYNILQSKQNTEEATINFFDILILSWSLMNKF